MELLFNHNKTTNHLTVIKSFIAKVEEIILCSGWMKDDGLELLKDDLDAAIQRKAQIAVISNNYKEDKNTEDDWFEYLAKSGVKHIIVKNAKPRYFHPKLYFFRFEEKYTAIIGSANLTEGALIKNEELSVVITGDINDGNYLQLSGYFSRLNSEYGLNFPSKNSAKVLDMH